MHLRGNTLYPARVVACPGLSFNHRTLVRMRLTPRRLVMQATHLLKYDSTLGPFAGTVSAVDDHTLSVDGKHIRVRLKPPTLNP